MKFLLTLHLDPALWETLADADKNAVYQGHEAFIKLISDSGEMVETKALADPATTRTVRVRDGRRDDTPGLFESTKTFLCGYYVVDVENEERALELAAEIPDARYTGVEVRQVIHEAGPA